MLFISIIMYIILALVITRYVFGCVSFVKSILVFYLITFSINVLISMLLSILGLLNNRIVFILVQFAFCCVILWALWRKNNFTLRDLTHLWRKPVKKFAYFENLLPVLIGFFFAVLFIIGITTPPNNLDSLHTHLPRIYYWLQHGSLANWEATSINHLIYPVNAHLQGLWLFLLGGNEKLFFLVSWFSLLVICCAVYETARQLNFSSTQALFSIMVMLTFPVMILQTFSFQNDLVVTALVMTGFSLLYTYRATKAPVVLAFAMLALSLSLGVKQTAFFALPAEIMLVLVMVIKKQIEKRHVPVLGLFLLFFIVFSSFKYIQNAINFHSFFGVNDLLSDQKLNITNIAAKAAINAPRFSYDLLDPGGLGYQAKSSFITIKANVFQALTSRLGISLESNDYLAPGYDKNERFNYMWERPLTEDTAWFGPLFMILIFFTILVVLIQKKSEAKMYLLFAIVLNFSYFIIVLIQRPGWDPYQGRYFILSIAPLVPLTGILIPLKKFPNVIALTLSTLVFVYLSTNIILFNGSKPVVTSNTVVNFQNNTILLIPETEKIQLILKNFLMKRTNRLITELVNRKSIFSYRNDYYEQLFFASTVTISHMDMVNVTLSENESLYLIMERDPLEYGLFGVNRSRMLLPITSFDDIAPGAKVIVEMVPQEELPGFKLLNFDDKYSIYQKE